MREKQACESCGATIYYKGLCWRCKTRKAYDEYRAMTDQQANALQEQIAENLLALDPESITWEAGYKAVTGFDELLAYRDIDTRAIAEAAAAKGVYSLERLYRDASPAVRDKLIEQLLQPDCEDAGNIQSCLALIGGQQVRDVFMALKQNPLPWQQDLYVGPSIYAQCGGWTFGPDGEPQKLVFDTCYAMTPDGCGKASPVSVGKLRADNCPNCGCRMIDIMTLDGRDKRLQELGLDGVVKIPLCPSCAAFAEHNWIRYIPGGESTCELVGPLNQENYMKEPYLAEMDANCYVLEETPAPPFRAYGSYEVPTIGGHPNWIQDWTYKDCPDCGKPMRYFATVPWSCISDGFEGNLYLEICTGCQVIGAFHQQT